MSSHFEKLVQRYPLLAPLEKGFYSALDMLLTCVHSGGKILTCGNGGSAADAEHIVGELMKRFLLPRPLSTADQKILTDKFTQDGIFLATHLEQGIPALSLVSGVSLLTAFANDVSAELCFAQQVYALAQPQDIVWGISTSGNSANVNHALRVAHARGAKTLGLTGRDGGVMAHLCDVELRAPAQSTPEIQEFHLPLYHALCAELEATFFAVSENSLPPLRQTKNFHIDIDPLRQRLSFKPHLIIFDFDGIMTDNTVFVNEQGIEMVCCSREDSLGLSMLRRSGYAMTILSTEINNVVSARAKKLQIPCIHGCSNKKIFLEEYFSKNNIDRNYVIYMGNDVNDKEAMSLVGCSVCPNDAHHDIISCADIVLQKSGGRGAVRQLCDMLLAQFSTHNAE